MDDMLAMADDAPNVDDIRDTVITQIVEGGYVTAIPIIVLSLYLFVQGYRRLSLITAIAGAAIGYLSASTLYPVSYTHLTLPTIREV